MSRNVPPPWERCSPALWAMERWKQAVRATVGQPRQELDSTSGSLCFYAVTTDLCASTIIVSIDAIRCASYTVPCMPQIAVSRACS